jgi:hypothetical protein
MTARQAETAARRTSTRTRASRPHSLRGSTCWRPPTAGRRAVSPTPRAATTATLPGSMTPPSRSSPHAKVWPHAPRALGRNQHTAAAGREGGRAGLLRRVQLQAASDVVTRASCCVSVRAAAGVEGTQVWSISVTGGEAQPLTRFPLSLAYFKLCPARRMLAFVTEIAAKAEVAGHAAARRPSASHTRGGRGVRRRLGTSWRPRRRCSRRRRARRSSDRSTSAALAALCVCM